MPESTSSTSSSISSGGHSITLYRYGVTGVEDQPGNTIAYRMKVVASDAENMPNEIFVYRRLLPTTTGQDTQDRFENVASPADIAEYAVGEPEAGRVLFRLSEIDLVSRNLELLYEGWDHIVHDVWRLARALNQIETLELDQTIVIDESTFEDPWEA